ncbi:conjugal transfer protein, partial [Salmonella enterica subsp. enterica serovar Newport str. S09097]
MNVCPLLILLVALPLHAVELVKWERIPLPVALNIGQERIVFVDRNVRVGYPAALEGKLRIQSSNGTLYLLASQSFAATRLQLQDTENGELILLDVSASKGEHIREPMRIVREEKKTPDAKPDAVPEPLPSTPLPVALTRYAAQML